jgi:hypothetical protein
MQAPGFPATQATFSVELVGPVTVIDFGGDAGRMHARPVPVLMGLLSSLIALLARGSTQVSLTLNTYSLSHFKRSMTQDAELREPHPSACFQFGAVFSLYITSQALKTHLFGVPAIQRTVAANEEPPAPDTSASFPTFKAVGAAAGVGYVLTMGLTLLKGELAIESVHVALIRN